MDWLLISCIASASAAIIIGLMLYTHWRTDTRWIDIERKDYGDRIVRHGDQHPWMPN